MSVSLLSVILMHFFLPISFLRRARRRFTPVTKGLDLTVSEANLDNPLSICAAFLSVFGIGTGKRE